MLLDCDSKIFIDDEIIEFTIGSSNSVSERPLLGNSVKSMEIDGDIPMGRNEEDEDPHVLVQQSHPQESLRRGSSDLAYFTPAVPETIREEPGVQETPSIKSRFMNPDSATVTLSRALPREDTFGFSELTPKRNKSTAKSLFPSHGLEFGGHSDDRSGEIMTSQLLAMDNTDLSTSDEEEEVIQSGGFFKLDPVNPDSVESTADEETLIVSTGGVTDIIHSTTSTVILPQRSDGRKENLGSEAEDMRRQFSEAPMITSFTAGSVGMSKEASPATEEESDRRRMRSKGSPVKSMKQGVPEGFLYEEHKKDVTPKQTYGKNKRAPRAKPKRKKAEMDKRIERAISEGGFDRSGRLEDNKNPGEISGAQESDEREEKEKKIPSRKRRRNTRASEAEDAIMETGDDVEKGINPPSRTQGRRGRMTVQSQPDSSAATTTAVKIEGRPSRRAKVLSPKQAEQDNWKPTVGEKTPTSKPTRPRKGARKQSDTIVTLFNSTPTTTTPTRSTRKRQRTPEDSDEDQKSLIGEIHSYPLSAGEAESVIHVAEPQQKRAKTAPPKKPTIKTPVGKRGGGRSITPTSPSDDSAKLVGDTQYTFPDVTQTQTIDHVEAKTSIKTPKKTPRTVKKKAAPSAKKFSIVAPTRNKKELTEEEGPEIEQVEGVNEEKTRTRDRYDGDSPRIVFSNSGLDGRKVHTFCPQLSWYRFTNFKAGY